MIRSLFLSSRLPEGLEGLVDLAMDLRWTWTHQGDRLWERADRAIWEQTQNPWVMLHAMSRVQLEQLVHNDDFCEELRRLMAARDEYMKRPGWFTTTYGEAALKPVAFLGMEFGLGQGLPLYAGGLGILAGDYLKTASDLRVPMVGIGLLYQEGYFRQMLNSYGFQVEAYPYNDPTGLPISPVMDASGGWLKVPLELPGRTLRLRAWQVQVGQTVLYLLDSNDPTNSPADRGITNKLYDANPQIRLLQEMALGICGWRLLQSLNIPVEVCHMNEGHTAFVVIERARALMQAHKLPFGVALCAVRAGNIFSTHTPVAAGFDTFAKSLVATYLSEYLDCAGIPVEEVLALGRQDPTNTDEPFNMAYLAMRGSIRANGVSWLHGRVSRRLFQVLYPRWPEAEVPVSHITNGVHIPSWDSAEADALWTKAGGKERWLHTLEELTAAIAKIPDEEIWATRACECRGLIDFVRTRLARQLRRQGADPKRIREAETVLDCNVLTVGFARRFTDYKRPNLLLTDPERLAAIITDTDRPLQLVVAGKAHPQDDIGKRMVQQFVLFASRPALRRRVVFLEDYDISVAEKLVQGVDLWINTPRRPWEACGTSGMKTLVNGGLNFSELDGWWAEAYSPEVGWSLGDGKEHVEPDWDAREAEELYTRLENEIIPEFYDRGASGMPARWVARMRASMSRLAPRFSSNRMLREYVENMYLPVTAAFRERASQDYQVAKAILDWQESVDRCWPDVRFGPMSIQPGDNRWLFQVNVYLGELQADHVAVELYAEPLDNEPPICIEMRRGDKLPGANAYVYNGEAPSNRPATDYTPRVVPFHASALVPLEDKHICWER